jgi:molybdopterin/thiamine biosynthesis adenylyltransferase/rhodanese-related sulfurtransferase
MPREITVDEAHARQRAGAVLVDVREDDERALGMAQGALGCARAALEGAPARWLPDPGAEILLICASGRRSLLAAQALESAGYRDVSSVAGGTLAWQSAGLPMAADDLDATFRDRYARHLVLPQVGLAGQRRLQRARVLLVGAGGLGSPCAFYLAAAGVGHLRIADADTVERSNLQRQILHTDTGIGQRKVDSARERLLALNPGVTVDARALAVRDDNVDTLMADVDVVVDGSDNFPTRYLLNDAGLRLGNPLVSAAVERFAGQVTVFDAGRQRGHAPCYRCLYPEPPGPEEAPDCSAAGVLGVMPGLLGLLQATETLKLLLGIGEPLIGRWLQVDALTMRFRELAIVPDPGCPACAPGRSAAGLNASGVGCTATRA